MVLSIGTDVVDIFCNTKKLRCDSEKKDFALSEQKFLLCSDEYSVAGIFAATNAMDKAFGSEIKRFVLHDIEILNFDFENPSVVIRGNVLGCARNLERPLDSGRLIQEDDTENQDMEYYVEVYISYSDEIAVATAVITFKYGQP